MEIVKVSFHPVQYEEKKFIYSIPTAVVPESLVQDPNFHRTMYEMGREGFSIKSIQPITNGIYARESGAFGGVQAAATAVICGYYFFWTKEVDADAFEAHYGDLLKEDEASP